MQQDPRNIFVNQRTEYQQPQDISQTSTSGTQQAPTNDGASGNSSYEQKVAEMKRLAEKYQREGEGQLVKDILNNVIEQKAKGQLTNEQLLAFAKRVTPLLNADQRNRLGQLVEQLLKV